MFTPPEFHESRGVPREMLNNIYNCADLIVSTSVGEGWGLATTEAFAAGTPVVVPDNTVFPEIVGENEERGYLAKSGSTTSEFSVAFSHSNYPRPLTNVESMVEKMELVKKDWIKGEYIGETKEKIDAARRWAEEHTWEIINKQWIELFDGIK